jgi:hypothetical protein
MERRTAIPVYDVGSYAEESELALVRPTNMPPSFNSESLAMDGVPVTAMGDGEVPMLAFLHALLLLYVDGVSTFGEILERSGLPELEFRAGFDALLSAGVVTMASTGSSSRPPASRSGIMHKGSMPPSAEEMWSFVVNPSELKTG